ncbi:MULTISPECIES: MarR family transcriptional regulator [unclassified Clostridium]|uniref:MarR family winged helix-turn-helix transcriptional regulator n=1 Tax=unclassified Clostridium TaxID=2614128 RepID=UPI0002979F98|nr:MULTISPECIES: MarR family transcriptional regulator [unclassified Clostridium]EKQ51677.1 MAG: transcriptional regulator [Clostridium sp. Maddingley MBC34-26]
MENSSKSIEVARLFQEVMHQFRHNMKKVIGETGMSAPQGMVIGLLSKYKRMKISELSSHLCLSNSTVSGIIDRLEAQEMVIRERSTEDKRVVYVSISPKFEDIHKSFHEHIENTIKNAMSQGSEEELNKIFEGLNTLKKLLNEQQK